MTAASVGARPPAFPPLWRLSWQRMVIELKIFSRTSEQVFFTFLLPVLFLVLFALIFSGDIETPAGNIDFATYFVPGIIASGVMASTFANLAMSIAVEQHEGLLKRLAGTPLPKTAFFAGRIASAIVITVVQTAIMLAIGKAIYDTGMPPTFGRWLVFAAVLGLSATVGAGLGIAYTRLVRNGKSAPAVVQPPFLLLQFISGVYLRYDDVPGWLQGVANVFPLKWMAEGFRYAFLPDWFGEQEYGASWGWHWPMLVLAAWGVAAFVLCLLFFRWDRQQDR